MTSPRQMGALCYRGRPELIWESFPYKKSQEVGEEIFQRENIGKEASMEDGV